MNTEHTLAQHKGLLYAKRVLSNGCPAEIDLNDPNAHKPGEGILWLHMCAIDQDTRLFLNNATDLDEIVINALLASETRPRILIRKQGCMVNLRAMNLNENQNPEDMISLSLWIDEKRIITTRQRDILAIEDIKNALDQGQGPKNTGEFLTMITNRVYARMDPFIEDLDDRTSEIEEMLALRESTDVCEKTRLIRLRTAVFRRYIMPQKVALEELIKARFSWLTEANIQCLIENHDRVMRYIETLNDIRDRAQIINDEIDKLNDARLNSTAYMFSVVATIFLPLSFLTGLMGINIGGMPGVDHTEAFWIFTLLCFIIALLQILIFKKIKWF